MKVVDMHAHITVPEVTRGPDNNPADPYFYWEDGRQYVDLNGRKLNSQVRESVRIDRILAEQDKVGVDVVVLSPWSLLFQPELSGEEALVRARKFNDALAKITRDYPERVIGLGMIPMQDAALACAELKRLMLELGLRGVEIGTNVRGEYLGEEQFRPIFQWAEELSAVIRIHPVLGVGGNTRRQHYMWNSWANPVETSLTAAHMIMRGVMESFPKLKVVLSHGGGTLPYQMSRLDRSYVQRPEARQYISQPPSAYFKRFYFDTITHSPEVLRFLIDQVGVDQIVLGSDYPFDMGHERPADIIAELGLSAEDQAKILNSNAMRLLS